jgi:hypothetical protein
MLDSVSQIVALAIDWHVGSDNVLTILVAADGTINRMGDGRPTWHDRSLYVGRTPDSLLPHLTRLLNDKMLMHTGRYELAPIVGIPCSLVIHVWSPDRQDTFEFHYGSESGGLPVEIPAFVTNAIQTTQGWYEGRRQQVKKRRPWWKLW